MFNTVPKEIRLTSFYRGDTVDGKEVMKFLTLTREHIAELSGVKPDSVRFDDRMSKDVQRLFLRLANVCELVAEYFEGDKQKTATWFRVTNHLLDMKSPIALIKAGRLNMLEKVILETRSEK